MESTPKIDPMHCGGLRASYSLLYAATLVCFAGCALDDQVSDGIDNNLGFHVGSDYPADIGRVRSRQSLSQGIAVGAFVDIETVVKPHEGRSELCSSVRMVSEAPSVLEYHGDQITSVLLESVDRFQAKAPGTARITKTVRCSRGDVSDSIDVRVVAPNEARIWSTNVAGRSRQVDGRSAEGITLRPGAQLDIAALPGKDGQPLLGYGFINFEFDQALLEGDCTQEAPRTRTGPVNMCELEAKGVSGETVVTSQFGGGLTLVTLGPDELPELEIMGGRGPISDENPLVPIAGGLINFSLTGYDPAGRYVHPSADDIDGFSVEVVEGTVRILRSSLVREGGALLETCQGRGTIRVSFMDSVVEAPIDVAAELEAPDCSGSMEVEETP